MTTESFGRFLVDDLRVEIRLDGDRARSLGVVVEPLVYGLPRCPEAGGAPDLLLTLRGGPIEAEPEGRAAFSQGRLRIAHDARGWLAWTPWASVRVVPGPTLRIDATFVRIAASPGNDELLWVALLLALRLRGRFHLHGALVEADRGRWLLVGPSGSGKSTTAVVLRAAGMVALADDAVLLRPDALVIGLPRPFQVPRQALGAIADLAHAAVPSTRSRVTLDVARGVELPGPVSAVVILRGAGPETVLRRCAPTTALVALMEESALMFVDGVPLVGEHMHALGTLLADATVLELSPGPDALERPRALRDAIERELDRR